MIIHLTFALKQSPLKTRGFLQSVDTKTPDFWNTSRDMIKQAKLACDEAGIYIPFPQRDIHIVSQPKDAT